MNLTVLPYDEYWLLDEEKVRSFLNGYSSRDCLSLANLAIEFILRTQLTASKCASLFRIHNPFKVIYADDSVTLFLV